VSASFVVASSAPAEGELPCPRCKRPLVLVDGRWPAHQITARRSPFCVMSGKAVTV
jgi:hypothetical protein